MPTYEAIKHEVRITFGFVPKTCWTAHVFELLGKNLRVTPNRINPSVRKYPCPAEKQASIVKAICKLQQQPVRPLRSSL